MFLEGCKMFSSIEVRGRESVEDGNRVNKDIKYSLSFLGRRNQGAQPLYYGGMAGTIQDT